MIRTKKTLLIALAALASAPGVALGDREVIDFNREWRFTKGEQTDAAKQLSFDDSSWQTVRLPHDWAIAGPFQPEGDGELREWRKSGV